MYKQVGLVPLASLLDAADFYMEEESRYTLEMTMGYLQTDRVQVEQDLIEKAITGENRASEAEGLLDEAAAGFLPQ